MPCSNPPQLNALTRAIFKWERAIVSGIFGPPAFCAANGFIAIDKLLKRS
jgi:hypothetical protein